MGTTVEVRRWAKEISASRSQLSPSRPLARKAGLVRERAGVQLRKKVERDVRNVLALALTTSLTSYVKRFVIVTFMLQRRLKSL